MAEKKEMDASLSVKLPKELLEKCRKKSDETGIAISFIVRKALEEWIKAK
jgi:predicted DNA-binding protein